MRRQDRSDLVLALRGLADDWEDPQGKTNFSAKIGEDYAKDLRTVLDAHT